MQPTFKKGDVMTIIGINSWGMCNRAEFKYYGEINGIQAVTANEKGARKKFRLPNLTSTDEDRLTFARELPKPLIQGDIIRDGFRTLQGNCCLMIYGTVDEVRALVAENLNQNFNRFDGVMALDPNTDVPTPAYPETITSSHPVMAIRNKQIA